MSDFFREHFLVHTHIEKTAGSTLTHGFVQGFGEDRVRDLRGKKRTRPEALSTEERGQIYVLAGHFLYGSHLQLFDRKPLHIACVRPPLQRYRSAYDFARTRPEHPGYPRVQGKTFRETIEDLARSATPGWNGMSRVLSGEKHIVADRLFRHLEENYLIVSPHDRVNQTLNTLVPLLGGAAIKPALYRNRTDEQSSEDIGDMKQLFDDANYLDTQLVQFVEDNYERWLKELPARLAR